MPEPGTASHVHMFGFSIGAGLLVHIAALFYVAGFLVRDQLLLRMLVFTGTLCYLGYYYFAQNEPLWDAMFWSVVMGSANLSVIVLLVLERTTFQMSDEDKALFAKFDAMTPGEFRRLMKLATRSVSDGVTPLVHEGEPVKNLHFVELGRTKITKKGSSFKIDSGSFIGEVGYFLDQDASATAVVEKDGRYVTWDGDQLKKLQKKDPPIRAALYTLMTSDLAGKVARSIG